MSASLLETKLYVPNQRGRLVPRRRLSDQLERAAEARLTLVSAPAGFGKTTLLAAWLAADPRRQRSVAWLSLDETDNTPTGFWTYVIAALRTVAPHVGASSLALLQSIPPPLDAVLSELLNDLSRLSTDSVLVLDDYHVIENREIHNGVAFLLDHLAPPLRLVIASRADPALPLARLRARGELVEIRAAALRFTPDEAGAYFNQVMELDLGAHEISLLETRTEGWIAALQLAALSLQGRQDSASFIAGFAGDDRYIGDYLVDEVLQRQPERLRRFLLDTSILDRLFGPLCDAVTDATGGKATLEAFDRGNLFVIRLDDQRRWYRYHHLFRDLLRSHLAEEQSDHVSDLHRRASAWYAQNGDRPEAIRHALAAPDFGKAAELIELEVPTLRRTRQEDTLRDWLAALPDELLRRRPVLSNVYAGALLASGQLDGVDVHLGDAERWLAGPDAAAAGMLDGVDENQYRQLAGSVAVHRAGYSLALGKPSEAVSHARRALELAPQDDHLARGGAAGLLGLVAWGSGDLETAEPMYTAALASLQRAGHVSDTFGLTIALAQIHIAQAHLGEAMRAYEQALQLGTAQGRVPARGTADMYVGLSEIFRERNELDAAARCLDRSQELGEYAGLPQNRYRAYVALARIQEARGDLGGALHLLRQADAVYAADFFPNVRPIPALQARVFIRQAQLAEARAWARERRLSAEGELSYVREFEHLTFARLLLAQRSASEALQLSARLLRAADDAARTGSVIEVLVVQALAQQASGASSAAVVAVERALSLAEPERQIRVFLDEGTPMQGLLEAASKGKSAAGFARYLLTLFGKARSAVPIEQASIEPLSDRELDVLRLLGTDLDGPQIARELVVTLNTVRTHTKNIYSKLGVNNRRAAIRRAEELDLLS
jgi:LuxR family maltose regulon positive regulatory protein